MKKAKSKTKVQKETNNWGFMPMRLKQEAQISTPWGTKTIPLNWANEMIGVVPVFSTREAAMKLYPDAEIQILRW